MFPTHILRKAKQAAPPFYPPSERQRTLSSGSAGSMSITGSSSSQSTLPSTRAMIVELGGDFYMQFRSMAKPTSRCSPSSAGAVTKSRQSRRR